MDEKDFRILAELVRHPLASHGQLGRAANVSALSAARRLQALEEEYVLAGFFAMPAASILGRTYVIASASANLSPTLFPARLMAEPDVVWVTRDYGGEITMGLFLQIGTSPDSVGLTREAGWAVMPATDRLEGKQPALSPMDWRLIDALIDQPRADITELARRTGLPIPTVNDRRDKLLSTGALDVKPVLLAPQGPGTLVFVLHVGLKSKEAAPKVREAVEGGLLMEERGEPPVLVFLGRARSFTTVQDLQARLSTMPGVAEVSFTLNREAAIARDRLHAWLSEAAQKQGPSTPKGKKAKRAP